jgi:YfiH family protein
MIVHSEPLFSIAFGNKENAIEPKKFFHYNSGKRLIEHKKFTDARKFMRFETLIVNKQTHGTDGLMIKQPEDVFIYQPYKYEADFIVTNLSYVGIGVATADCLPIIFYDQTKHVLAVAHAGWQGTLKGIGPTTIQAMQTHFGCNPENIKIFFGPCAQVGSYEVGPDFIDKLADCPFKDDVIIKKNGSTYFNLPLYNQILLEQAGVRREAFRLDYNICTISDPSFCSYRRDAGSPLRNMTIAALL